MLQDQCVDYGSKPPTFVKSVGAFPREIIGVCQLGFIE